MTSNKSFAIQCQLHKKDCFQFCTLPSCKYANRFICPRCCYAKLNHTEHENSIEKLNSKSLFELFQKIISPQTRQMHNYIMTLNRLFSSIAKSLELYQEYSSQVCKNFEESSMLPESLRSRKASSRSAGTSNSNNKSSNDDSIDTTPEYSSIDFQNIINNLILKNESSTEKESEPSSESSLFEGSNLREFIRLTTSRICEAINEDKSITNSDEQEIKKLQQLKAIETQISDQINDFTEKLDYQRNKKERVKVEVSAVETLEEFPEFKIDSTEDSWNDNHSIDNHIQPQHESSKKKGLPAFLETIPERQSSDSSSGQTSEQEGSNENHQIVSKASSSLASVSPTVASSPLCLPPAAAAAAVAAVKDVSSSSVTSSHSPAVSTSSLSLQKSESKSQSDYEGKLNKVSSRVSFMCPIDKGALSEDLDGKRHLRNNNDSDEIVVMDFQQSLVHHPKNSILRKMTLLNEITPSQICLQNSNSSPQCSEEESYQKKKNLTSSSSQQSSQINKCKSVTINEQIHVQKQSIFEYKNMNLLCVDTFSDEMLISLPNSPTTLQFINLKSNCPHKKLEFGEIIMSAHMRRAKSDWLLIASSSRCKAYNLQTKANHEVIHALAHQEIVDVQINSRNQFVITFNNFDVAVYDPQKNVPVHRRQIKSHNSRRTNASASNQMIRESGFRPMKEIDAEMSMMLLPDPKKFALIQNNGLECIDFVVDDYQFNYIDISSDSKRIISCGCSPSLTIYQYSSFQKKASIFAKISTEHGDEITQAKFINSDRWVVTVSSDYTWRVFDINSHEQIYSSDPNDFQAPLISVDYFPKNHSLILADAEGTVVIYSLG